MKLLKRIRKGLPGFGVWLFWATVQALVGGALGLFLVALYLRAH